VSSRFPPFFGEPPVIRNGVKKPLKVVTCHYAVCAVAVIVSLRNVCNCTGARVRARLYAQLTETLWGFCELSTLLIFFTIKGLHVNNFVILTIQIGTFSFYVFQFRKSSGLYLLCGIKKIYDFFRNPNKRKPKICTFLFVHRLRFIS